MYKKIKIRIPKINTHENILYDIIKHPKIHIEFYHEINGYQLLNRMAISGIQCEECFANILSKITKKKIKYISCGSHQSGCDIKINSLSFSIKSSKINIKKEKKIMKISSYRMTEFCNNKDNGNINMIISEIKKKSKNFKYYSILAREEYIDKIHYIWYIIPKKELSPDRYTWDKTLYKKGRRKGEVSGYKTNIINGISMSIIFSMSSQLWITINDTAINKFKKYIVSESTIFNEYEKIDYALISKLKENGKLKI